MKKLIALVLALICVLSLAGCQKTSASCQKTISASEVYLFPEPTILITGSFYSQGKKLHLRLARRTTVQMIL